jgi:hypothetical protein
MILMTLEWHTPCSDRALLFRIFEMFITIAWHESLSVGTLAKCCAWLFHICPIAWLIVVEVIYTYTGISNSLVKRLKIKKLPNITRDALEHVLYVR